MILYFVSRNYEILGLASTNLSDGYKIISDELTEDIDSGVASLTASIAWDDDTRLQLEEWTGAGNYILTEHNKDAEMFAVITHETDTADKAVTIYAEDAGLDLINEIAPAYTADATHNIAWYINYFLGDSDFEIGTNEIPSLTRKLTWDGDSTVTERLRSIATQFGNAELSYSFAVENLRITHKYINIWSKRGTDAGQELRLGRDINSIRVITSAEELYTGLIATGNTPEGADVPISLKGYHYDDGDIFVDSNGRLLSRSGADEWGRMTKGNSRSYIMGRFTYETATQSELCNRAVTYLKAHKTPAINYEVNIERGLENSRIGDRINIVDDKGGIYVSARILALKTSVTQQRKEATLGEYLIKSSGISDKVIELAGQFQQIAKERDFLYSVSVSSSAGSYFINTNVNTILTASVFYAGGQLSEISNADVNWYSGSTLLGTGFTYTVSNETTISITCKLERDGNVLAEDYITLFSLKMIYETAESALTQSSDAITADTLHYLATDLASGVTTQTAGWTTTPQTMTAVNKYLWTYHTYTKGNGTTVDTVPVITGTYGEKGDKGDTGTGIGVSSVQPQYYLSDSPSTLSGGSWSTTLTYTIGKYIWTRDEITYTDSSVNYSTAIYNGALTTACANSETALQVAGDTEQHFWTTSTGTDTGSHITKKTQTDFVADPQNGGSNLLARSNGIAIRDGLTELANFSADGITFDNGTPFVIGNNDAYIEFDPVNSRIVIGGNNISLNGQQTLAQTLTELANTTATATSTADYFWFKSTGTDTGAHITETTQTQFEANPSGGNLLATSSGLAVRDGLTELANFGASAIQIGQTNDTRLTLTTSGLSIDGYGIQDTPVQFMFLGDSELRANANFNINIGHGISSKTDTYLTTDRVHMDFAHTSLKFDGSSNAVNDPVIVSTEDYDNGIQFDSDIIVNADATFNNDLHMKNAKIIYGKDTNGTDRSVVQAYNGSNNVVFGYGGYEGSLGNTNIYGNHINFTARGDINANQPLKVGGYKIITTQTFNADNISVTANGYKEGNISIAKTGYTPIGVMDTYILNASSSGTGSSFALPYRSYISGNNYYYGIRSVTSSAIKVRIYARILYVASTQGI